MDLLLDLVSWLCLATGSAALLVGGYGLLRMPDFFTRLHPAGITDTAGVGLILVGLMFQAGLSLVTVKLVLVLLFVLLTAPTASHATARAAVAAGLRAPYSDVTDDVAADR